MGCPAGWPSPPSHAQAMKEAVCVLVAASCTCRRSLGRCVGHDVVKVCIAHARTHTRGSVSVCGVVPTEDDAWWQCVHHQVCWPVSSFESDKHGVCKTATEEHREAAKEDTRNGGKLLLGTVCIPVATHATSVTIAKESTARTTTTDVGKCAAIPARQHTRHTPTQTLGAPCKKQKTKNAFQTN